MTMPESPIGRLRQVYLIRYEQARFRMNTTKKYLYGRKEIEPLSFKEVGISNLELEVICQEIPPFILAKYSLDVNGKIKYCQRKELEWTAFPTLNGAISINKSTQISKLGFIETHEYRNNKLNKSTLTQTKDQKVSSKTEYSYQHNQLIEILKKHYKGKEILIDKQSFKYDSDMRIVEIDRITELDSTMIITNKITFRLNALGLIDLKKTIHSAKIHNTIIKSISREKLHYNSFEQIERSIETAEMEDETVITEREFKYLTNQSDKINEIRIKENNKKQTIRSYEYDKNENLQNVKIENNGHITETIYRRTK